MVPLHSCILKRWRDRDRLRRQPINLMAMMVGTELGMHGQDNKRIVQRGTDADGRSVESETEFT